MHRDEFVGIRKLVNVLRPHRYTVSQFILGNSGLCIVSIRLCVVFTCLFAGCTSEESVSVGDSDSDATIVEQEASGATLASAQRQAWIDGIRPKVEKFCGDCHVMPRPGSSTKEMWVEEVNQGFALYGAANRNDLEVPQYDEVLKFFQYQAPSELKLPTSIDHYPKCQLGLQSSKVRMPGARPPGVTNVQWIDLGFGESSALVYCDIGTGMVNAYWPQSRERPVQRLATLLQPVHTEPCDLNEDGLIDLIVADIGEFNAEDSEFGRVVWLRRDPTQESFQKVVLVEGLSRIADVRPGDFDADGDTDLLVGVFGWRETGEILLLVNEGLNADGIPTFAQVTLDKRHGAVNLPTVDLNGDGHLDFVALLSQEHEVVEAFINDGEAGFDRQVIWSAPDPAYGSSGIELSDIDGDGDIDVLMTNGDSFDRGAKPYHCVQWLENTGSYPYRHHVICEMPGVLDAVAGDFDGDGDQDIVAVSLLAGQDYQQLAQRDTSSIVYLEQTSPNEFARYQVEARKPSHLSLVAGDFDGNGGLDFSVGTFLRSGGLEEADLVIYSSPLRK